MMTSVLVVYASKHGATQTIAERIAEKLETCGLDAEAQPVKAVHDLTGYDALVIGGAAYYGSWMKELTAFTHRHASILTTRPVWLFSSGPLGTETVDAEGKDLLVAAEPKQFAQLAASIKPRGEHVFFGALNPDALGVSERLIRKMPAGRTLLPGGDFRDWHEIEAWAESIACELTPAGVPT